MAQVTTIKAAMTANKSAATATAKVLGGAAQGLYDRINAALQQQLEVANEDAKYEGKTPEEIEELKQQERTEAIERLQAEAGAKLDAAAEPPVDEAPAQEQ